MGLIVSFELSEGIVIRFYARFVKVKDGASGVGLIISCGLAGGGSARFYTRVSRCLLKEVLAEDAVLQRRGHRGAGA